MLRLAAILAAFAGSPVAACPLPPDITDAEEALLERLAAAESESEARLVANELWRLWTMAPDEPAQELLDTGMDALSSWNLLGAKKALDRLVGYCPGYAEGYNQRAFMHFLSGNYDAALPDLDRAIALAPNHFGARAGRALTLLRLGRGADAQIELRAAVALNPWLAERHLLDVPPGEPL